MTAVYISLCLTQFNCQMLGFGAKAEHAGLVAKAEFQNTPTPLIPKVDHDSC